MNWQTAEESEQQQRRELQVEAADEWVSEQSRVVHASAGLDGPWGALHPVAWSYCTGRITASSVPEWRQRYESQPEQVAHNLAQCVPALGPQGPQEVHASSGMIVAAGITSLAAATEASPARPRGDRNAVDELRTTHDALVTTALRGGPAPEMFPGTGDQPRATASGIEVAAIAPLPWRARLAAAWAGERSEAFRISQDFGGPDGAELSRLELNGHPAVAQYVAQVQNWAATSGMEPDQASTDDEVALFGPRP